MSEVAKDLGGFIGLVLAIIWFCVPFALFGIKPLLESIGALLRGTQSRLDKTNELLEQIRDLLKQRA